MGYKDLAGISKLHMIGSGIAILSNRISYLWDLKGTSATVDTGWLVQTLLCNSYEYQFDVSCSVLYSC